MRYVANQIDQLSRGPGAPDLVKKTLTENYAAWWPADQDWPPNR